MLLFRGFFFFFIYIYTCGVRGGLGGRKLIFLKNKKKTKGHDFWVFEITDVE